MRVLLDTTAVLDMTSTNSKYAENRNHYLQVRADNECFVTPVTVSEAWSKWPSPHATTESSNRIS